MHDCAPAYAPSLDEAEGEWAGRGLQASQVDAKLWAGAGAAGWSLKAGRDSHYVYYAPGGERFTSKRAAEEEASRAYAYAFT